MFLVIQCIAKVNGNKPVDHMKVNLYSYIATAVAMVFPFIYLNISVVSELLHKQNKDYVNDG